MQLTEADRKRRLQVFLTQTVMRRYQQPKGMPNEIAVEVLDDAVEDLNEAWPLMTADEWTAFEGKVWKALRRSHKTQTWPNIPELLAVSESVREKVEKSGRSRVGIEDRYEMCLAWWRQFRNPMPGLGTSDITRMAVDRGVAGLGELNSRGFPIPDDMRSGDWRNDWHDPEHDRKLEDVQGMRVLAEATEMAAVQGFRSAKDILGRQDDLAERFRSDLEAKRRENRLFGGDFQ